MPGRWSGSSLETAMQHFSLGLDIGSISVNTVLIDAEKNIVEEHYTLCHGRPFHALDRVLTDILTRYPAEAFTSVAITGTGGKLAAELIGGYFVNEIVAQSSSVAWLYPEAKTVIEMGGEDSKLIIMNTDNGNGSSRLADFAMNTVCAAGTGSFLDQQAKRIGVSIEKEFGEMALKSENPPHIAGRCSVFAKSDMIHLQQIATPVHDIGVDLEPVIFVGEEHLRLFRQHYAKVSYRKFGNLALHFQEVLNLLIEAARYYVHTPLGVDQLGYNP